MYPENNAARGPHPGKRDRSTNCEYKNYCRATDEEISMKFAAYFRIFFLTSSSLQACNITLFGTPGVIPE